MSAVSVVPPMHATQRPIAASSSVSNWTSTGPFVVAIRTRNLPTVKDISCLQEFLDTILVHECTGRCRVTEQAQGRCVGLCGFIPLHHHLALLSRIGQRAFENFAGRAFQQ